jgi:uncharacterized repeat protein (TIGR01451 family)
MNAARQAPGLAAAPDGSLYVSGGGYEWIGLDSAERYDPAADRWTMVSALNSAARAGSASAYAAGRVFAIGGVEPLSDKNESLSVRGAFCVSDLAVEPATVVPGGRITYTVTLRSDAVTLPAASLVDPIPAGTAFAGFGANPTAPVQCSRTAVEWRAHCRRVRRQDAVVRGGRGLQWMGGRGSDQQYSRL